MLFSIAMDQKLPASEANRAANMHADAAMEMEIHCLRWHPANPIPQAMEYASIC